MEFRGFTDDDFEVFAVPGLEPRMAELKARLRPKLEQLGQDLSEYLSQRLGRPMWAHVAKHARRTVNPPDDSWVAFCHERRGYKKHPHFQVGAWRTHAFAVFGVISECPGRAQYAARLLQRVEEVKTWVSDDYVWIPDHTNPASLPAVSVDTERLLELFERLGQSRQGELLVGICIPREEAVELGAVGFEERVKETFNRLIPFYELAID
ncbi:MAG: DUF1054 domain-containing protein [Alicyclobacillus herbarius]|uniref:DUF1054 domain-containing protein n=1 Tax=Alicyclobacillus herbarius TaxID=122960 RepID=UPI002355D0C0|nr:DUF1054 domain-containing protein [Alicyclobacillus herbarius]MCL6631361.1 DUF1054 domain-containing protein [Alicyclobacillus herbarius]